jgi:hypothetical protein
MHPMAHLENGQAATLLLWQLDQGFDAIDVVVEDRPMYRRASVVICRAQDVFAEMGEDKLQNVCKPVQLLV